MAAQAEDATVDNPGSQAGRRPYVKLYIRPIMQSPRLCEVARKLFSERLLGAA